MLGLLVVVDGGVRAALYRVRAVLRMTGLRVVFTAWGLLYLAGQLWTMVATSTVSLDQVGPADLVRGLLLGMSLLVASTVMVGHGWRSLQALHRLPLAWFTLFGVWSAFSLLWTTSLPATAYKTIEFLSTLLVVAVAVFVIGRLAPAAERWVWLKRLFDWQWLWFTASMLAVGVGVLVWPGLALSPGLAWIPWQLRGVFPSISFNGVGELGTVLCLVCMNRLLAGRTAKFVYVLVGAGALTLVVLAQSRSAIIGLALGTLVLLVHYRAWRWFAWMAAAAVVVLTSPLQELIVSYMIRGRPTTIGTLTGRTRWWEAAFEAMQERPLEGFGAFTGGKHVLSSALDLGTSTLHNSYVEAWAGTGLIGLVLFATAVVAMAALLVRYRPPARAPHVQRLLWGEAAAIFALLVVRSVFSVAFLWPPMITTAIVLVYLGLQREWERSGDPAVPSET